MRLKNNSEVRTAITADLYGNLPQHIALVYSAYDVIEDDRINMENPVQMQEVFNAEEDITPGNCCSANLEVHIANTDRAMNEFNFARNFGLYFGIEDDIPDNFTNPYTWATSAPAYVNGLIIAIKGAKIYYALSDTPDDIAAYNYESYMDEGETFEALYVTGNTVHAITSNGVEKGRVSTQATGETARDRIVSAAAVSLTLPAYTAQRILNKAAKGITDMWRFYSGCATRESIERAGSTLDDRMVIFVGINVFKGEKPRKQLCDDIDFTVQDVLTYLDGDAKPFIMTDFATAKTRNDIITDIFTQVNTETGVQFSRGGVSVDLGSDTYEDNPFADFDGYTYRDILKDIAESAGVSIRLATFTTTLYTDGGLAFLPQLEFTYFSESSDADNSVYQNKYYDLQMDEYDVTAIQKVRVQASADDVGVILPDEPAGDNGLAIIDNPLLIGDSETEIKSHCTKIFDNISGGYSGGYRPGTLVMPHNLLTQVGDCLSIQADLGDSTVMRPIFAFAINTTWNGYAECTIESTGQKKREVLTKSIKQKLRSGRKYHEFIVDVDQLKSRIGNAEGSISLIEQDIGKIQTEVSSQNNSQILRDTRFVNTFGQDGASNIDWEHSKWGRAVGSATADYTKVTISDCPDERVTRGLRMSASTSYDTAIYQDKIPVDENKRYCLSGYFRSNTANAVLTVTMKEYGTALVWYESYTLTYTETGNKWQRFVVPLDYFDVTGTKTIKIGLVMPNTSGVQITVCGLKLELGTTATPWSEADEYVFTRITQTEAEVLTEMQDALGNYYTKSETASKIQTDMTDALGNYYTKTETAQKIQTDMSSALGNYYTKTETAQKIQTDMTDALGNYYTKTETASEISTYVGNHAYEIKSGVAIKTEGVEISGGKYVKIKSGGSFTVESNNFSISATGVLTAGYFRLSENGLVYNDGSRLFAIRDTKIGSRDNGVNLESNGRVSLLPCYGNYGCFDLLSGSGYLALIPQAITVDAQGNISKIGTAQLGRPGGYDGWDEGYITDIYYSNLYQTSSREMKEDITPLDIPGSVIDGLTPVSFRYKTGDRRTHYGLIHEDTLPLLPEICKGSADEEPQKKAIDYMQLVTVLLSEVQKLRARVSALEGCP